MTTLRAMAILVDTAIWPFRGRRWAHLVSDRSHAELHTFADGLGLRRSWFQGDHYDVPTEVRIQAIALGAQPVTAAELVRRLRDAGLRQGSRVGRLPGDPGDPGDPGGAGNPVAGGAGNPAAGDPRAGRADGRRTGGGHGV